MKQTTRFIFWLMLLALPLQGFAQVGYLSCHMGQMDTAQHDGMAHMSMDHGTMDPHADAKADPGKKACCTCAVACTVMALPVVVVHIAPVIQHVPVATEFTPLVPTQAPVPPDRPPRFFTL